MKVTMTAPIEIPANPNIADLHELALQQSLEQQQLGYLADVEVPREVILPKSIGMETMAALGIRRKLHERQLMPHPTDQTKMVITGLKNRIYY